MSEGSGVKVEADLALLALSGLLLWF
jgi:hypothetical protein